MSEARTDVRVRAVLLAPGAGSSADHHTLVALEAALAPLPCVRLDFPYRLAGRRFPDRAPVLVAHIVEAVEALCAQHGLRQDQVLLGGRSMGGRMCSMAVAEGLGAAGLVLLGYPLHPPRKPEQLRTAHFGAIGVPCLFVSGTRDDFATVEELTMATAAIPAPVTHRWIENARHDLDRCDDRLVELVTGWVAELG
ncbi:MAG: alpha/beta hydrolase fold domain-containing protein [Acidimicrobiales bacterium]|nr:alpha/beta hydrolase fold domain-containing protein [Acidimicrobiales bacterium]